MSIWKSDQKLLIFASLISPLKIILFEKQYQACDAALHQQMKHLKVCQKYSAARRIFNSLLSVSPGDETLLLTLDILHEMPSKRNTCKSMLSPSAILNFVTIYSQRKICTIRLLSHSTSGDFACLNLLIIN